MVTSSVSLPPWLSRLAFCFILIRCMWWSVVNFPLLGFTFFIHYNGQHFYQTIVQFDKTIVFPRKLCNREYTWLRVLLLLPSGYSIWGTENCYHVVLAWEYWSIIWRHLVIIYCSSPIVWSIQESNRQDLCCKTVTCKLFIQSFYNGFF